METRFKRPLCGIVPPLPTPLCDRDTLDAAGLERLIEHVVGGGVHGVFILGTSGEAPGLSQRLRRELVDLACRKVAGRVPVLVGITDTAWVESINLARHAARAGADAVVVAPPYYYPATPAELGGYLERLIAELPLPVFLYNTPQTTKIPLTPAVVERMLEHEQVIGLKDSAGDLAGLEQFLRVAKARLDWSVFVGPEHLLVEALGLGAHGGVNGGATFHPRLLVGLYEAVRRGDQTEVAVLREKLAELGRIYGIGGQTSAVIKGMKCALSLLGICDDFMAEPFVRFQPAERAEVQAVLEKLGLLSRLAAGPPLA